MKSLFKKLIEVLCKTWVWSLLLVFLLAASIWNFGPLLAVSDNRFWEGTSARLITISVLFLVWGLGIVFTNWRGSLIKRRAEENETGKERLRKSVAMEKERLELASRFSDAQRVLKDCALFGELGARSRKELPWYVLIGPQGSGKTSLLDFSGLDFPLDRPARKLTRDTSITSSCDWYFTHQAILLDTSGRYFDQPDPQVDGGAWMTLLGLLQGRLRTQPLSGVLVTLPVDILLDGLDKRLEKVAGEVRVRLDEVFRQLHVDVPVYLVLTKADSIAGFDDFLINCLARKVSRSLGRRLKKGSEAPMSTSSVRRSRPCCNAWAVRSLPVFIRSATASVGGECSSFPISLGASDAG